MNEMYWLPALADARARIRALSAKQEVDFCEVSALANSRLDFILTNALDECVRRLFTSKPPQIQAATIRLALIGSCTLTHLKGAIRVSGIRRNLWIEIYECAYGQCVQELADSASGLQKFNPDFVLIAFDGYHIVSGITASQTPEEADDAQVETKARIAGIWKQARGSLGCSVIHQTVLPVHLPLLGQNEHRLAGSPARFVAQLNHDLRAMADSESVDLLAVDAFVAQDGLERWHDRSLWHRSKQEIAPSAAPLYAEGIVRIISAKKGWSAKCLVLDLDNTLWGGVLGDDGLEGIVIGQGSPLGEAYVAFQQYVRELSRRGVIIAICSKNDEALALEPFEHHPEMVLRRGDIAAFAANWSDKPHNIRALAQQLNIGLDSLVFVDDNPFERELVRRELPMVRVPEISDEPASYARTIADAGYFEAVTVTTEDRARSQQYQGNKDREAARGSATDLPSYLRSLEMRLIWRPFDRVGLQRILQLINKSNQFNLTTRRYNEKEVLAVMNDSAAIGLQFRLQDRFGDNGIIAIVIGRLQNEAEFYIDTWLMSCRVLGRQVERAMLNLIVKEAVRLGAARIVGQYIPSEKNKMVRRHYPDLGFVERTVDEVGHSLSTLDVASFNPAETFMHVTEG
jgi:FkbH-like protein